MLFGDVMGIGILNLATGWGTYLVIAGFGLGGGLFGTLSTVVWPRYFGKTHLGAISGYNMAWMVFGSALGPWIFGLSIKFTDSYMFALLGCMVLIPLAIKSTKPSFEARLAE